MTHYLEDFSPGRTFDAGSRVVTAEDIRAFADVSGDHNPLHLDPGYARRTTFGGPVAHGVLGIAVATGLVQQAGITAGSLVALVGLEWAFRAPVRPGDRVSLRLEVLERRPTRQPDRGIVRFRAELTNQAGDVVQDGVFTEIVKGRDTQKIG